MDEELLRSVAEKAVIETAIVFFAQGGISDVAKAAKDIAGKVVDALPRKPEPGPATRKVIEQAQNALTNEYKHVPTGRIMVDLTPEDWCAFLAEQEAAK
jgi:hypothetical protein